ncbi:MAG: AcvB/VirJ family lysyl-phosphatidylglycerol hydrolase [Rickettsiales bacterium]
MLQEKLTGLDVLCVYGSDETAGGACDKLKKGTASVVQMQGGHHFGGDYEKLAQIILERSRRQ